MRASKTITANFIRTESSLTELAKGPIFLTLYVDDLIDSNATSISNATERYRKLMVKVPNK